MRVYAFSGDSDFTLNTTTPHPEKIKCYILHRTMQQKFAHPGVCLRHLQRGLLLRQVSAKSGVSRIKLEIKISHIMSSPNNQETVIKSNFIILHQTSPDTLGSNPGVLEAFPKISVLTCLVPQKTFFLSQRQISLLSWNLSNLYLYNSHSNYMRRQPLVRTIWSVHEYILHSICGPCNTESIHLKLSSCFSQT